VITIRTATNADLDALVESQSKLFRDDAGVHDRHVDITWPARLGHERYAPLIDDDEWLILVAAHDAADTVIGHLVGYWFAAGPTRYPARFAVLQSIYVDPDERDAGVGSLLTQRFLEWSCENGCVEAGVSVYAAQRFYARHGFAPTSVEFARPL
jgi:GNAT superfamily N-acetyltransferase